MYMRMLLMYIYIYIYIYMSMRNDNAVHDVLTYYYICPSGRRWISRKGANKHYVV